MRYNKPDILQSEQNSMAAMEEEQDKLKMKVMNLEAELVNNSYILKQEKGVLDWVRDVLGKGYSITVLNQKMAVLVPCPDSNSCKGNLLLTAPSVVASVKKVVGHLEHVLVDECTCGGLLEADCGACRIWLRTIKQWQDDEVWPKKSDPNVD